MLNTDEATRLFKSKMVYKISVFLVLVGGINWLTAACCKMDAVSYLLGKNSFLTKFVYVLVGVSALTLFFNRDTYLPFLGESLIPCAAFAARTPDNANRDIEIITEPNTKVIYWASEPKDASNNGVANWNEAYGDYANSGVAIADDKGRAILRIRGPPQSYKVPLKGVLQAHVHYRICQNNGMIGPVQIHFITTGRTEAFKNHF